MRETIWERERWGALWHPSTTHYVPLFFGTESERDARLAPCAACLSSHVRSLSLSDSVDSLWATLRPLGPLDRAAADWRLAAVSASVPGSTTHLTLARAQGAPGRGGGGRGRRQRDATGKCPACVSPLVALATAPRQQTHERHVCHSLRFSPQRTTHDTHTLDTVGQNRYFIRRVCTLFSVNALHGVLRGGDAAHSYRPVDAGLEVAALT